MLIPTSSAHLENEVLQTRSLSCWPVDSTHETSGWDACGVKDEIPNLSIEDIG